MEMMEMMNPVPTMEFQMISNVHRVKPFDPMKNLSYMSTPILGHLKKKHPAKVHFLGMVCNTCFTKMAIIYCHDLR
jgi:hypothetical protein